ncbi:hypothetical protein XA68_18146 [Ophiocordyceps unilateralis]|uniref:Ras-GAP domain-containing protein n=1 Tax=Ophiocordyceps unilateralis TaxID=268505 RepID=A0A2A9PID0_OPHUN|nr:hypothetical protein XA68_18146 [Ophiocordyceps unilateralis]
MEGQVSAAASESGGSESADQRAPQSPNATAQRYNAATVAPLRLATPPVPRVLGSSSQPGSPIALLGGAGGGSRRQGIVFGASYDSADSASSPVQAQHPRYHQVRSGPSTRPRTRTLDTGMLAQRSAPPVSDRHRHRIGSVSSPPQPVLSDESTQTSPQPVAALDLEASIAYQSLSAHHRPPEPPTPSALPTSRAKDKDKKSSSNKRLLRRLSSRPASPVAPSMASVDSFAYPVAAAEPARVISFMSALEGRMRGDVDCQVEVGGAWRTGFAFIDDEKGCLVGHPALKGFGGSTLTTLVPDLRGCRVLPIEYPESGRPCLELIAVGQSKQQQQAATEPTILLLRPLSADEWNLWLAALLCWQQVGPPAVRAPTDVESPTTPGTAGSNSSVVQARPALRRQGQSVSSTDGGRASSIIKVGTVMLWDKGPAATPHELVRRSSTRDTHLSSGASWRKASCILHEDGEFRLLMENGISVLCVIQLSQLSRYAIQQLDSTVLDSEYCLAIFPTYAPSSTHLSIFRPVYLALESRVPFEVWFVLLRAFAVPDVHRLGTSPHDEYSAQEHEMEETESAGGTFRIIRTVGVRVTEAKVRARPGAEPEPTAERGANKTTEQPDPQAGDYLAEVIVDNEVRARTTTRPGTRNPFWREDCEFSDLPPTVRELTIVLKRVVDGSGSKHGGGEPASRKGSASSGAGAEVVDEVVCGIVNIGLDELERGKDLEEWRQITDERQQAVGSMLVKVSLTENVALLAKEYEPLSELLHRFPTGLTTMISAALPGQLRRLSETFLDIFQASGSASSWLMALVEDEMDGIGSQTTMKKFRFGSRLRSGESGESSPVSSPSAAAAAGGTQTFPTPPNTAVSTAASSKNTDRELLVRDMSRSLAGEANLLFRGNTLLTQSLEFHMRRLGAEYLAEVLRDKIVELDELDPDCEVDPSRLPHLHGHHHSSHSVAAEMDQRWNRLMLLTTEIWRRVADSADRLPAELRHILKYIRAVAEDRYGDFLRTVTYTAVSGFLFLRFICPAILSPKLFGLLRDHPRPRAQRTLTLIAKVLQKMSNMSVFGKREEWMEPMNKFLSAQRPVFRDYIDRVCGIPVERAGVVNQPPSYRTPETILKRLGPDAREGSPSLPYLIDVARSFASLVKLWVDSSPRSSSSSKTMTAEDDDDGELLASFDSICQALQTRADACLVQAKRSRAMVFAAHGAEQLAESREQATLIEALSCCLGPADSTTTMTTTTTAASVSEEVTGRDAGLSASAGGTARTRNGKVGRTILSGIMRIGGRAESPDFKHK